MEALYQANKKPDQTLEQFTAEVTQNIDAWVARVNAQAKAHYDRQMAMLGAIQDLRNALIRANTKLREAGGNAIALPTGGTLKDGPTGGTALPPAINDFYQGLRAQITAASQAANIVGSEEAVNPYGDQIRALDDIRQQKATVQQRGRPR